MEKEKRPNEEVTASDPYVNEKGELCIQVNMIEFEPIVFKVIGINQYKEGTFDFICKQVI